VDIVDSALDEARRRCGDFAQVRFANLRVPEDWPEQKFDLVLLSEMLYFLTPTDIGQVAQHVCQGLLPGGLVLLVNYTGQTDDPCNGNEAAETFIAAAAECLRVVSRRTEERFRVDLLEAI